MGNYEQLKQAVSDVIKTNGNQEITGAIMQNALLTIISTVGDNATFAGIATPTTNPGMPDQNVFYLASEPGVYSNFGGVELTDQVFIFTNKNGNWLKQDSGIATSAKVFELGKKTRKVLTETATTDKSDVIENSIIELKIFKDDNTKAYINSFTGNAAVVQREFIIKTSDGDGLCSKSSCLKTNIYDNVWIYENDNLRAVIDFGTNNDYIINEGANNNYEKTGINSICYIKNKYYYNSINNLKKDMSDIELSLNKEIDDNKNVYQDEFISDAWVVTGKAISVKNGEEVDLENAKSTDYIPIGVGALQITQDEIIGYYSSLYGVAAYNSEKQFIKGWSGYPDATPSIILPENTAYIRTCTTLDENRAFKIKNNIFFGSKNNLIIQNKNDIEVLKEAVNVGGNTVYVVEPFKPQTYIVANIGQEPIYKYYQWCSTYRIDVKNGDVVWVYNAYVNQNRPTWATLDSTGKVVRKSDYLKYGYTRRITIEEGEVALVWTQTGETSKGTYLIENYDSYILNKGTILNLSANKIQTDSVNAQIVQSKSEVGGIKMFVAKGIDSSSEINVKINDNELFFVGIWFYIPTSIQKNIESIIIDGAEKKSLSFSNCDIQLMTKYLPVTGRERTITIKVSLKESVVNTDLIFGGIIKNQIVKPAVILDFDSTYQYSEDEGVYDWILEEYKLPMTIHVGELAQGSSGNITDWQKYINSGQVDIGTYGGSINLHPTGWTGIDALKKDPYGEKCPNISDIKNNIDEYMNTFIDNYSVFPLSFGGQQYYCPKKAQKVILSNGYKATRLPTGNGSDLNISFGVSYAKDRLIYGDSGYGLNKINGVVKNLGVFNIFNHGLSDDHAGEGVYTSFSEFKESINQLMKLYNEGALLFINYSMYYKMLVDNNLIVDSTCL